MNLDEPEQLKLHFVQPDPDGSEGFVPPNNRYGAFTVGELIAVLQQYPANFTVWHQSVYRDFTTSMTGCRYVGLQFQPWSDQDDPPKMVVISSASPTRIKINRDHLKK